MLYKLFSLVLGVVSGMLAGAVFKKMWKALAHQEEAPAPTAEDRGWHEVLPAAALKGATVAVVKAAVGRGGAASVRRLTGTWPG